jgi:hypothetical protein
MHMGHKVLYCISYSVGLGFARESSNFDFNFDFVVIVRLGS